LSIVALLTPRFSKLILKEHSQIDNFNAKKLWGKKGKGVGQKHIDVWYTSLLKERVKRRFKRFYFKFQGSRF